jgi:hypothetical protein
MAVKRPILPLPPHLGEDALSHREKLVIGDRESWSPILHREFQDRFRRAIPLARVHTTWVLMFGELVILEPGYRHSRSIDWRLLLRRSP